MMTRKTTYCFSQFLEISKKSSNSNNISMQKSKVLYDGSIKHPAASNQSLAPALNCSNTKQPVKFDGSCLKQEKVTFSHKKSEHLNRL